MKNSKAHLRPHIGIYHHIGPCLSHWVITFTLALIPHRIQKWILLGHMMSSHFGLWQGLAGFLKTRSCRIKPEDARVKRSGCLIEAVQSISHPVCELDAGFSVEKRSKAGLAGIPVSVWLWSLSVVSYLNSVDELMFVLIVAWNPWVGLQAFRLATH